MKSPLKQNIHFNVVSELKKIIKPKSKISSFFLHGGEIEISLARRGCVVVAHTNKIPIYEFWSTILKDPKHFSEMISIVFSSIDPFQFSYFQSCWHDNKNLDVRTALYYILINYSDQVNVSCGKMIEEKMNPIEISKIRNFKVDNFFPTYDDCESAIEALPTAKKTDYVLMPIGKYSLNLFETGKNKGPDMYTFKHKEIHDRVKDLDKKCILLYKNHTDLFKMYNDFNIKMVDKYGRSVNNKEFCEDLIITNF